MADVLRIKRRTSGAPGVSGLTLANAELAYNEVDHMLYYGEGTGGAGGTASTIVPIGGQGLFSGTLPLIDGTASVGVATSWARGDHVHPTDTTRAPIVSPVFTGNPTGPTPTAADSSVSLATTAFVKAQGYATGGAVPGPASTTPLVDAGTGVVGTGTTYARNDHVHPTDASRAAASAVPVASATVPVVDTGAGSAGAAVTFARGDHVHPTDTSRAPTASPTFTGTTATPNVTYPNSSTQIANTAFVSTNFAPLVSPSLSGTPTGPTASTGTNTTQLATTAFVLGTRQDQQAVPTTGVSWNNQLITNLGDPIAASDAANKRYVDQSATGLLAKGAAAVASIGANLTLSGLQSLDGYTMVANDRVLVKDQTLPQNNGIYVAVAGAWTRATDMDTWLEVPQAYVFVSNGTLNANSSWVCNSVVGGTLGTTAITWVQFSQAAQVTAGAGLTRTGNSFDVIGTASRIAVFADNIDIDSTYVGQVSINTLGSVLTGTWNATTIAVNRGGSGATTLTGYLKGNGTSAFTASATIPNADIAGLGTMALQNANTVAITGGTIDGIQLDGGSF